MKELELWRFIYKKLLEDEEIAFFVVADSSDSSPGRQGFKMAIASSGEQFGTIGGGIMEANLINEVLDNFSNQDSNQIRFLQHDSHTSLEKSGLICGGTQTVIIKLLTKSFLGLVEDIIKKFDKHEKCLLSIEAQSIKIEEYFPLTNRINFNLKDRDEYKYLEVYGIAESVYIIGGGHVGLAVSRIMSILGFYVTIFDHRSDVFTLVKNTFADQKIICKYEEAGQYIPEGGMTYVIIVTPQHTGDKAALKSVINKNVKYIGMMGSKRKIYTVFNNLKNEGIDEKLFKKVHTPIGLEIEARTPDEIAVSIAAEIINVKNQNLN